MDIDNNQSPPLLTLLPGLDGTVELYREFCEVAGAEVESRVIGYPTERYLDLDELVEFVEERIPEGRPVILMGVSFSGPIAARLLARGKRKYVAALFCTTFVTSPHPVLLKLAPLLPLRLLFLSYHISGLVRFLFFERTSSPALIKLFQQVNNQLSSSVVAGRVRSLRSVDERKSLKDLTIPCCYLRAKNDRIVPKRAVRPFRTILRGATNAGSEELPLFTVIPLSGPHALLQCRPEESWEAIREFLREYGVSSDRPEQNRPTK